MNYQLQNGGAWCDSRRTEISVLQNAIHQNSASVSFLWDLSDETQRRLGWYWFGARQFRWFNRSRGLQSKARFVFSVMGKRLTAPLEQVFELRDAAKVRQWLHAHPHISDLLEDARAPLRDSFPSATLRLQVVPDPEAPRDELVLSVVTAMDALKALDAMDEFDRCWWLKNMQRARGELQIVLDWE